MHRDKKMENVKEMLKYLDNRMRGYKYSEGRIEEQKRGKTMFKKIIKLLKIGMQEA